MQVQYSILFYLFVTAMADRVPTVVLSVGAFKLDYLKNIKELRECLEKYATAKYMMPVMPTKGPVNHMSIATGLFADGHGVIDDCEYDEPENECVYGEPNPSITPIWIENQEQGGISAVMDWPGAEYTKEKLTYYQNFESDGISTPQFEIYVRINQIIKWLTDKDKPATLVMVYYDELDKALHGNSVDSEKVQATLFHVQYFIINIINELKRFHVNIIVLGSHGRMTVNQTGGIDLNEILKDKYACHVDAMGANALVTSKYPGKLENVYKMLEEDVKTNKKYSVYYQKDIPEIWHLKELPLFQNKIFLVANTGYFFWNEYLTGIKNKQQPNEFNATVDGYWGYTEDDQIPLNHTFFMVTGPEFVTQIQVPPFNTTDVYQLLRKLLEFPENEKLSDVVEELYEPTGISVRLKSPVVEELSDQTNISEKSPKVKDKKKSITRRVGNFFYKFFAKQSEDIAKRIEAKEMEEMKLSTSYIDQTSPSKYNDI